MTRNRSFQRKVIYGSAIALLLFPLYFLGQPASVKGGGGKLAEMRDQYKLSQGNLGDVDPASETMKLVTLGMRPFATVYLWEKANTYKKKNDWDNLAATLNQITKLDPNIVSVWEFQAHNLSYNVSVEFDDYRYRYLWVKRGIDFLIQGTHYNRNEPRLLWNVGWFVGHKMGRSDEKLQFRRLFRRDEDFHRDLQDMGEISVESPDAQGPDGRPDSWLVSRLWYEEAEKAVNQGKPLRGKSPLMFYADGPMARINYSMAIEDEGILDEKAQIAWEKAGDDWRRYGDRSVPHTAGHLVRINDLPKLIARRDDMQEELDELVPGARKAIVAEKRAKLADELKVALDTPITRRSPEQHMQVQMAEANMGVSPLEIADRAPEDVKSKARALAERLYEFELVDVQHTNMYRSQVNYDYWESRCAMEGTAEAVAARRHLFEAEKFMEAADLEAAKKSYEASWDLWAELFARHPRILDDITVSDIKEPLNRYADVLKQLDQKMPADFKLRPLWDRMQRMNNPQATPEPPLSGDAFKPLPSELPKDDSKPDAKTEKLEKPGDAKPEKPSDAKTEKPADAKSEKPDEAKK